MRNAIIGSALIAIFLVSAAKAQTCPAYTYPTFTSGTTAVAAQVTSNFTSIMNCANSNLAPLASPHFTGNVNIGTTTSIAPLVVVGPTGGTSVRFENASGITGQMNLVDIATNNTGPSYGGAIRFIDGTNLSAELASIANGGLLFLTNNNQVGIFDASGKLGVGTTSPSYTLHVNGSVAGTSAYNNLSDSRLKKNVRPITQALSIVERLNGVRFSWRTPQERLVGKRFDLPVTEPQVGFIAQDVKAVLPEAVTIAAGADAIMSLQESKVVPVLVEAVKELKATNDILAKDNAALKSRLDENERRLSELELRAGIRSAANDNLVTRVASVLGW